MSNIAQDAGSRPRSIDQPAESNTAPPPPLHRPRALTVVAITAWLVTIALVAPFDDALIQRMIVIAAHDTAFGRVLREVTGVYTSEYAWLALGLGGLLFANRRRLLATIALGGLMTAIFVHAIKSCIGRARPEQGLGPFQFVPFTGPELMFDSFPSGHTANAFAIATLISLVLPWSRWPLWCAAALVGLCRVAQYRHYPSDAVAGAAVGIISVYGAKALLERWAQRRNGARSMPSRNINSGASG